MYLSDEKNISYITDQTGLSLKELESLVGRFKKDHHSWPNKLKGLYLETWDGEKRIVHHFTQKLLWSSKK